MLSFVTVVICGLLMFRSTCSTDCDSNELVHLPFCWGLRQHFADLIIACGCKGIDNPQEMKLFKASRSTFPSISVLSTGGVIFAQANDEYEKKIRPTHRTSQPKKNPKQKNEAGKQDRKKGESEKSNTNNVKTTAEKLKCRYRKSCYNDGIENIVSHEEYRKHDVDSELSNENDEEQEKMDEFSEHNKVDDGNVPTETDVDQMRLVCRYRYSCYEEKGFKNKPTGTKYSKNEPIKRIITSKASLLPSSHQDFISTKDVATNILRDMEKREKRSSNIPKFSPAEKLIIDRKQQEKNKNMCKYRKSCYETGKLPTSVKQSAVTNRINNSILPFLSGTDEAVKENYQDFNNMTKAEQKVFCKYRKSCYDTGSLPNAESTKQFNFKDVLENNRKEIPLTMRCKYRKSCYKTGIIPEISKAANDQPKKQVYVPLPSTENELKLFCKYRKDCYKRMSETDKKTLRDVERKDDGDDSESKSTVRIEEEQHATSNGDENKSDDHEKDEEIVEVKKKKKLKAKPNNKVKEVVKQKETTEAFCDKLASDDKFRSIVKNDIVGKKSKTKKYAHRRLDDDIVNNIEKEKFHVSTELNEVQDEENDEVQKPTTIDIVEINDDAIEKTDHPDKFEEVEVEKTGEIGKDEQSEIDIVTDDISLTSEDSEDDDGAVENINNVAVNKVTKEKCKYRKSCYSESTDDQNKREFMKEPTSLHSIHHESLPKNKKRDWSRIRKNEQLKCRYRKSCYDTQTITDGTDDPVKFTHKMDTPVKQLRQNPKNTHSRVKEAEKENSVLSKEIKYQCKYRRSCYGNYADISSFIVNKDSDDSLTPAKTPVKENIIEDKNKIVLMLPNGTMCSKYRISCREQVGLPRKERAPIGPNGKKLCRKQRTN